jgi:exodeoxyribonuclease VIII
MRQIRREIESIKSHRAAMELIESGIASEVSVRWRSIDGDNLRCRPDLCTDNAWVDLKTTREADILSSFWKSVIDYGYHAQDAHYQSGMEALGMEPRPLIFVVVSTTSPHECHVVTLPQELVAEGRRLLTRTLADIRLRMDLDYWMPDQHGEVVQLPVPAHVMRSVT